MAEGLFEHTGALRGRSMTKSGKDLTVRHGFYGRLKPEFPSQINVDATEVCNLACIHCAHPLFKKSEHYRGRLLDPDLNSRMVDEVRQYGRNHTQYIRYSSNGEPLMHPQIYDMIEYAVRRSGVMVTLTTNGTLMNETRSQRLLSTGVDVIDISIDAFSPETYARIRVNGNLHVTRENVLRLLQMARSSSSKTKVIVSYIEQPQNVHETRDFEVFWRDSGAHYVVIRRLHSNAGIIRQIADCVKKENAGEPRYPCLYPWERILLNARGYLSFCPVDWTHGSTIPDADYRRVTIRDIWQGEFYRRLRLAHLSKDFADHAICAQCPDWRATRWPKEGRSYADMVEEFNEERA
jgi:pyruvate-formate lyase-activating enzyme